MKCKCIIESKWFLIDDSFDEVSDIVGGPFSFTPNEVYEYHIEDSWTGKSYVVMNNNVETGFDESKFNMTFETIEHENISI